MRNILCRKEGLIGRRYQNIRNSLIVRGGVRHKFLIWNAVDMSAEQIEVIVVCAGSLVSMIPAIAEKWGWGGKPLEALAARAGTWVLTVAVILVCASRLNPGQGWLPWHNIYLHMLCSCTCNALHPPPAFLLLNQWVNFTARVPRETLPAKLVWHLDSVS